MSDLAAELNDLLKSYEQCWTACTPTKLRGLWHPDEQDPYYIAEEMAVPMFGWGNIEPYWREAEQILKRFSLRTWDLHCKLIGPNTAALQFMMHWNAVLAGLDATPIGLDVKVFTMAEKTAQGWKFRHAYIESPLGAFPYIKSIYRNNVDSDFLAQTGLTQA